MPLGRRAAKLLRALDRLLTGGLAQVPPEAARELEAKLKESGFGIASALAPAFADPAPDKRYKAYVDLRLAIESTLVKVMRPAHEPLAGAPVGLFARRASPVSSPSGLVDAARRFDGLVPALAYLASDPDLAGLDPPAVEVLLANDDLKRAAARALVRAGPARVGEWIAYLVGREARSSRHGAYLLVPGLEPAAAARATLPSWARSEDHEVAWDALSPLRREARDGLLAAFDPAAPAPLPARRFALRLVARSARPAETSAWEPLLEGDPELAALHRIARFKAEQAGIVELRAWAGTLDEPILRATALAQLVLENDLDKVRFQAELQQGRATLPYLLGPLRGTSKTEPLVRLWAERLAWSRPPAERRAALEELVACGERQAVDLLERAARDPRPELRALAYPALVSRVGLLAVRRAVDFAPLAAGGYERFGTDVLHGYDNALLPVLDRVPDVRLLPYLRFLLGRGDPAAVPEAVLVAYGELAVPLLGELLDRPELPLARLARARLEALRATPEAASLLGSREAGADPCARALARLAVPELAADARKELEGLGRSEVVPRLVDAIRKQRELREPALEVLAAWRAPEAIPLLIKLLGTPAPEMVKGKPGNRESRWLSKPVTRHLEAYGPDAAGPLAEALANPNWTVRHHAATLLAGLGKGAGAAGERLASAWYAEKEDEVRHALVAAMGAVGDEASTACLATVLGGADAAMQTKAARALGAVGTPKAREAVEAALARTTDLALKRELKKALEPRTAKP